MEAPDVLQSRALEQENGYLKRIKTERDLETDALKEVLKADCQRSIDVTKCRSNRIGGQRFAAASV